MITSNTLNRTVRKIPGRKNAGFLIRHEDWRTADIDEALLDDAQFTPTGRNSRSSGQQAS